MNFLKMENFTIRGGNMNNLDLGILLGVGVIISLIFSLIKKEDLNDFFIRVIFNSLISLIVYLILR